MRRRLIVLTVNGERREVAAAEHATLLEVLREELDLTGTKHGCELGECGACTVLVDGSPWLSCLMLAGDGEGHQITTIEGLAHADRAGMRQAGSVGAPPGRVLDPLQVAFAELGAAQCGYCSPGMLLSARTLLDGHPAPTPEQVRAALAGNLCRCTGYQKITEAVLLAAQRARTDSALAATGGASDA